MKSIFVFLLTIPFFITAQTTVQEFEPQKNSELTIQGNLNTGNKIADLSWAWSSQNACFVSLQREKFTGNHVFYTGIIPKYSEMEVTVIPKDTSKNLSIYAYEVGVHNTDVPPALTSCIRCEADFKRERNFVGKAPQDHTRKVTNLVAINRPYRVVIAVVGAEGLTEADYDLVISMKSR